MIHVTDKPRYTRDTLQGVSNHSLNYADGEMYYCDKITLVKRIGWAARPSILNFKKNRGYRPRTLEDTLLLLLLLPCLLFERRLHA